MLSKKLFEKVVFKLCHYDPIKVIEVRIFGIAGFIIYEVKVTNGVKYIMKEKISGNSSVQIVPLNKCFHRHVRIKHICKSSAENIGKQLTVG